MPGTVVFDCCFLRHPLDRLVSVYTYFRGIDSCDPLCRRARRQTPRDFPQPDTPGIAAPGQRCPGDATRQRRRLSPARERARP
jgi:hypothetical protein